MIYLIAGASHTGKTLLAQRLLEERKIPYCSIDHIKMGLIRAHYTDLTPMDDALLTDYLWPVVREMIKTAIENKQNLTVEGCYIPAGWEADFTEEYLREIRYVCLVMTRNYFETKKHDITAYGSAIESRLDDEVDFAALLADNEANLEMCRTHGYPHVLIDTHYDTSSAFFGE